MADLKKVVRHIRVETAWLPTIDLPNPFEPGPPSPLLALLKPKITVSIDALGQQRDVVSQPYGDPGPSRWPVIQLILLGAVVTLGIVAYRRFVR